MSASEIAIEWIDSIEVVPLDTTAPAEVAQTEEWWTKEPGLPRVPYNVVSHLERLPRNRFALTIEYREELNPNLKDAGVPWGRSVIEFSLGASKGKAHWHSDPPDAFYDKSSPWNAAKQGIVSEIRREEVERIKREQEKFKRVLRKFGEACALTRETTTETLDAIHLVDVQHGGALASARNGLFLRTDLHRLYDAGMFTIDAKGQVQIPSKTALSTDYRKLLKDAHLSPSTLARVREALELRARVRLAKSKKR